MSLAPWDSAGEVVIVKEEMGGDIAELVKAERVADGCILWSTVVAATRAQHGLVPSTRQDVAEPRVEWGRACISLFVRCRSTAKFITMGYA